MTLLIGDSLLNAEKYKVKVAIGTKDLWKTVLAALGTNATSKRYKIERFATCIGMKCHHNEDKTPTDRSEFAA